MRDAIGGEIELSPALLESALTAVDPHRQGLPVSSGRTAIVAALAAVRAEGATGHVLLPSYICASVVQAVREAGMEPRFFRVLRSLSIDVDDVARRLAERPAALLFVDYFGFPVDAAEAAVLSEARSRCRVIEDCVQGSLVESAEPPVGGLGDFVVTSFRKYLPVPDGGLLLAPADARLPALADPPGADVRLRLVGRLLRHELLHGGAADAVDAVQVELLAAAERSLDAGTPMASMSALSARLIAAIDLEQVIRRRRENFAILAASFERPELRRVGEPWRTDLPAGVSPLVFPLLVDPATRDALRARLAGRHVFCPVHWPLPREVDPAAFPDAASLSASMLGLPIDQRYDGAAMERLLTALTAAWEETS